MIEYVIKRDGRKEPFNADKINGWGEWGTKSLDKKLVDWSSIVLKTVSSLPSEVTAEELQQTLIKSCLDMDTYEYNRMAGRLYASQLAKSLYSHRKHPTIYDLHKELAEKDLIVFPNYTEKEYEEINKIINHKKDISYTYYSSYHIVSKYSLQDRVTKQKYESPQFVYMRVAMQTFNNYHESDRLEKLEELYNLFSDRKINVPTPYMTNSLTKNPNVASCCVLTCKDTAESIGVMNTLAYMMTTAGAGLGVHFTTRSLNDPVRGGLIAHQGKIPYIRGLAHTVKSSKQGSRGGMGTVYYAFFDPEIETLLSLKNPLSTTINRVREADYAFSINKWFVKKAIKKEPIWLVSYQDAPEVYEAFYSKDESLFISLLEKFAKENPHKVKEVQADILLSKALTESLETGRIYLYFADIANAKTPYKDPIYSSNLCTEILLSTRGFNKYEDLYKTEFSIDQGIVAFCNLAGIVVSNIETEEEYEKACYYALLMIDEGINNADLPFPALNQSIRDWRSAGVGILGLAHLMAKKHLSYTTQEGRDFIFSLGERHAYYLYKAALRLGKERGNAPRMDRSLLSEGWLPMDTGNKNVLDLVTVDLKYDWETLRKEIIENKGVRFTTVFTIPPSETSSISCSTTNGPYPIRNLTLVKTSGSESNRWVAPEATKLSKYYEIAWEISNEHHINMYAILNYWLDQTISADLYYDRTKNKNVSMSQLFKEVAQMAKYGVPTRYYCNSKIEDQEAVDFLSAKEEVKPLLLEEDSCSSGGCAL